MSTTKNKNKNLVRFAPSPTGYLHLGNARLAVINCLFARSSLGNFLLRFDDTDTARSDEKYVKAIYDDLKWLGIDWQDVSYQSHRLDVYQKNITKLIADGRLYACYETPAELTEKRNIALKSGRPPIYDRAGKRLTEEQKKQYEADGRKPHWRFYLEDKKISWQDLAGGEINFEHGHFSDPVLIREDNRVLYTLGSVIDDIDYGVTHVIRGSDHISNTAVQIQIFEALKGKVPDFAHISLMLGENGENFSKRDSSLSLQDLRKEGFLGDAIAVYLAELGQNKLSKDAVSLADLSDDFDFKNYSRNTPRFNSGSLKKINQRIIASKTSDEISALTSYKIDEDFWLLIQKNITLLSDIKLWQDIIYNKDYQIELSKDAENGANIIQTSLELLPATNWDKDVLSGWLTKVSDKCNVKGRSLFMPIRLSLTGLSHGPEIPQIMLLMGKELAKKRLETAVSNNIKVK